MNYKLIYNLRPLFWVTVIMAMVSCSDDDSSSTTTPAIYPESINIVMPSELQPLIYEDEILKIDVLPLIKGESAELNYTITPENITFDDVKWTSSNKSVAVVDEGKVTAVSGDGVGYSIIQIAPDPSYSGSNIFGTLKVTVSNSLIPAESIILSSELDEVFAGETLQLKASIFPETATYRTVKWTSSDEKIAKVDINGLVTGVENSEITANATITATSLDGAGVIATKNVVVKKIIQPQNVTIDQEFSVDNQYFCAINEKNLKLDYSTEPSEATLSLIEWTSTNEAIATVDQGVVSFNQEGVFGDVTITATCPETGNKSFIKLHVAEGLVRELFHDKNNYTWYNAQQSGNGTSSSHVWSDEKITVTTYKQNATNQRADLKCWSPKTWLHTGNYPFFAIRIDDVMDKYDPVTFRAITLDGSGIANGSTYSGGIGNNAWLYDYKCSDGSHVFVYDLSTQKWPNGGVLPNNALATFTTFQLKYADIRPLSEQITYNVYWIQTFKSIDEVKAYITSEGLSFEAIKEAGK